jgi:L-glutamine-phosphate cytidylyltransferase
VKALILCAGQGTRLMPHTESVPKCLVPVGNAPILAHALAALKGRVDEVVLATGYLEHEIRRFAGDRLTLVHNPDFATTNSLYTLWLTRPAVAGAPFLLINGDIVFDAALVAQLVDDPAPTGLLVDRDGPLLDGEMNVVIRDGLVAEIGKHIAAERADALSLQLAKFGAADGRLLFERVGELVAAGQKGGFPANAFDAVIAHSAMAAVQRRGGTWFEIDTLDDLARCEGALASAQAAETKSAG